MRKTADMNFEDVMALVNQLPVDKKMEVVVMLEDELFDRRFIKLLKGFRDSAEENPLSFKEITKEVEKVRQKKYEDCH